MLHRDYVTSDYLAGYDHMPYIPFPENWPVYTPAQKVRYSSVFITLF